MVQDNILYRNCYHPVEDHPFPSCVNPLEVPIGFHQINFTLGDMNKCSRYNNEALTFLSRLAGLDDVQSPGKRMEDCSVRRLLAEDYRFGISTNLRTALF